MLCAGEMKHIWSLDGDDLYMGTIMERWNVNLRGPQNVPVKFKLKYTTDHVLFDHALDEEEMWCESL